MPGLLINRTVLAPASNTIISCNICTSGSCQVDGGVEEGRMPGQDAGHHRQAGTGVSLGSAGHSLQQGGVSLVSQFSHWWLLQLLSFTKPGFETGVFI